jgi:saccharopine dehydrogenase-like NADP-dependent oxidoreductase
MRRVLLLGAGLVSRPFVRAVTAWPDVELTVADLDPAAAARVLDGHPRGRAVAVSVDDDAALSALAGGAELGEPPARGAARPDRESRPSCTACR